jgi:hypothetical protein
MIISLNYIYHQLARSDKRFESKCIAHETLINLDLSYCEFVDCTFDDLYIESCNFHLTEFINCTFKNSRITESCDFFNTAFKNTTFIECNIKANLSTASFKDVIAEDSEILSTDADTLDETDNIIHIDTTIKYTGLSGKTGADDDDDDDSEDDEKENLIITKKAIFLFNKLTSGQYIKNATCLWELSEDEHHNLIKWCIEFSNFCIIDFDSCYAVDSRINIYIIDNDHLTTVEGHRLPIYKINDRYSIYIAINSMNKHLTLYNKLYQAYTVYDGWNDHQLKEIFLKTL